MSEKTSIFPTATQTSWLLQTHEAIKLLGRTLKEAVFEPDIIFTDDTPIPLLVKGNGRVKKARLWVYVRGAPGPALTVYDFSRDRKQARPLAFLVRMDNLAVRIQDTGLEPFFNQV